MAVIVYDGIARIVDVASHMVVGVLAPPRSSIDRAAFSPSGDTIVTVDRGTLVATLWRADSLTPIWSTTFPGEKYFKMWGGAAAFSPDGRTLLISPGADLYLLDVATGAIRATRNQGFADSAVGAANYGWGRTPHRHRRQTASTSSGGEAVAMVVPSPDMTTTVGAAPAVLAVTGSLAHVCAPASFAGRTFRLSPDGQMVAVGTDAEVRLLRRADGALVSTLRQPEQQPSSVSISPTGRYAVVDLTQPRTTVGPSRALFQTADGAKSTDLDRNCEWPTFSSDEAELDLWCSFGWRAVTSAAVSRLAVPSGLPLSELTFTDDYVSLVGNSAGCPVVVSGRRKLAWRACGSCSDQPFATTTGGVLSQDGAFFLGQDVGTSPRGSTLWRVLPAGAAIRHYPPRSDRPLLDEVPIAVSTHGDRVITTAEPNSSCSYMPGATNRVQDVATGTVVDELPPGIIHQSADLSVIAFDSVLWCAR